MSAFSSDKKETCCIYECRAFLLSHVVSVRLHTYPRQVQNELCIVYSVTWLGLELKRGKLPTAFHRYIPKIFFLHNHPTDLTHFQAIFLLLASLSSPNLIEVFVVVPCWLIETWPLYYFLLSHWLERIKQKGGGKDKYKFQLIAINFFAILAFKGYLSHTEWRFGKCFCFPKPAITLFYYTSL